MNALLNDIEMRITNHGKQVEPEDDPLNIAHRAPRSVSPGPHTSNSDLRGVGKDGGYVKDDEASKPSTRESISEFLRLTDRLFSRKKADNIEPQDDQTVDNILDQYPALNEKTYWCFTEAQEHAWAWTTSKEATSGGLEGDGWCIYVDNASVGVSNHR